MSMATLIREITLITIWILVCSSFIQGVIHMVTWWVVHKQQTHTSVGVALNRRELTLGIKALARTVFDSLLVMSLAFNIDFSDDMDMLSPFFVILSVSGIVAIYYGGRYLTALHREGWGQFEATNARQDVREFDQNKNETKQKAFQVYLDDRKVVQDALQVVLEEGTVHIDNGVTETIDATAQDVAEVKQDVKELKAHANGDK